MIVHLSTRLCFSVLLTLSSAAATLGQEVVAPRPSTEYATLGKIERLDPGLDKLVPPDARIERLAEGFDWAEGPLWVPDTADGPALLFSDVPRNTIYAWKPGTYGASVYLKPSGYTGTVPRGGEPGSNGLARGPEGSLTLMQHGDRRIARLGPNGFMTLADRHEGKRLNSPNDGVYDSAGNLYFTDPPYGLVKGVDDPARELDFQGVFRIGKDGKLSLLTRELSRPNGVALSPDEKTLYVSNSDPEKALWMAYPLKPDGTIGPGRVFADVTRLVKPENKGLPDGMKVDAHGNLFATGPGGVFVFSPEGKHLGTLNTGEANGNCAWGDDGSTLYIMADMYIGRIKLTTKGNGH